MTSSEKDTDRPGESPAHRSWFVLVSSSALLFLVFLAAWHEPAPGRGSPVDEELCAAARAWRSAYGSSPDLRVVKVQVSFHALPNGFAMGEAAVVAPIAVNIPGEQDVVEVSASPTPARTYHIDHEIALAWPYAGTLHREMRFTGMALVRRAPANAVTVPADPHFDRLSAAQLSDARLDAAALEEHGLDRCKAFPGWAADAAGAPPYTEQLLRILGRLKRGRSKPDPKATRHDLCASLREGRFSSHEAHVLAVMALRQIGAPAYGWSAVSGPSLVVATYVDALGWIWVDIEDPDRGYRHGGATLLAEAPLPGEFQASRDGFWSPSAAAYYEQMGNVWTFSSTDWLLDPADAQTKDSTLTFDAPLAEICP